jgi:hypothetical protein
MYWRKELLKLSETGPGTLSHLVVTFLGLLLRRVGPFLAAGTAVAAEEALELLDDEPDERDVEGRGEGAHFDNVRHTQPGVGKLPLHVGVTLKRKRVDVKEAVSSIARSN